MLELDSDYICIMYIMALPRHRSVSLIFPCPNSGERLNL